MEEFSVIEGYISVNSVLKSRSREVECIVIDDTLHSRKKAALLPLLKRAEKQGIPVEYAEREKLDTLAEGRTHGGVIAYAGARRYKDIETVLSEKKDGFFLYLDGIEDPYNFGQAVRAAYAAGTDALILPKRNWMTAAGIVARSSAGASELIDLVMYDGDETGKNVAQFFSEHGYKIVCADISENAVSHVNADLKKPLLLIVGGELRGISTNVEKFADSVVKIDYGRNFNAALGAAEASAILVFEVLRQNS